MKIIGSIMALGLVVVFLSQTAIADRIYFPFGFINKLLNFQNENQLTIGPYKDGTIILVKPVATGVGSSRAEAGDVVEVRDGQELFQRFGNDKPFLGKRERTKLLVFYYDGKLTQEQKQQLISPVYETKEGEYITNLELYQTQIEESQTGSTEKTDNNEETNLEQEPQIIKNRAYGIDYTKILSDKDILIARDPNKAFDKLPELDLTYLIKKQPDQFSVVEMTDKLVRAESITQKIEDTLHKIVPLANAQTACVSIVDPDNGDGTDYLSLNTWESTEERDLVTANETETATCRSTGGTADTTAVEIDGWTTDATRYIKVWTDPDEGYRHNGKWDESKYRLDIEDGNDAFILLNRGADYTQIIGIQFSRDRREDWGGAVYGIQVDFSDYFTLSHNIIKVTTGSATAIRLYGEGYIYNNIIYDWRTGIEADHSAASDSILYNNTVFNCNGGIKTSGNVYVKNCLSSDNSEYDFNGDCQASSGYNLSSDSTAPGSNSKTNATVTFTDEDNDDFHLASIDTGAKDAGTDLSADADLAFSDDIDGQVRGSGGAWDIGADERTSTVIETDPSVYRSISDPTGTNPTPFIATIMESGGDYSSLFDWEAAIDCDLTAATTKVFAHNGITGTISDGATVTGAASGASGTCLHVTDNQILIIDITGTFQSGEQVYETQDTNYVTISDAGDSAYAVAKIDGAWSSADDTAVTIDGWTTDEDHYVHIYTTAAARHDGKWNESKYRSEISNGASNIKIREPHTRIIGLQIKTSTNTAGDWQYGICTEDSAGYNIISHNIVRPGNLITKYSSGIKLFSGDYNNVYNNIVYDFPTDNSGIGVSGEYNCIYSNTVVDCAKGISASGWAGHKARNNLAFNNTDDYSCEYWGTGNATYNAYSEDSDPGSNGVDISGKSGSEIFVDYANDDFHLSASSDVRDAGADLSADANLAFSDDIDGERRGAGGAWDIGADEIARTTRIK
jgi:hypothetical protein